MSYSRRALTAVVLVVGLAASNAAFAVDTFKFYGYVVDPLGRPLQGAIVSDGPNAVLTNSEGFYTLQESSLGGSYDLRAYRFDTLTDTKRHNVLIPSDRRVDFQVRYRSRTEVTPWEIESLPFAASIRSKAYGPLDGQCVTASDSRTGSVIPLTYQSTAGGEHLFIGALEISVDAIDGEYTIESISRDCVSGVALTATARSGYVIWTDTVAPTGEILSPQAGHGYFQEEHKGPRSDGKTTVFGSTGVQVSVQDNREVGGVYVWAAESDGNVSGDCGDSVPRGTTSTEIYCTISFTSLGPATIHVRLADRQNNFTELEMPVVVGLYLL